MGQFHFTPEGYLELMHWEVAEYERMQDEVAAACEGLEARAILELGIGTGETARRVLQRHLGATLNGIDASEEMLVAAREAVDAHAVQLQAGRLEDALPRGPSTSWCRPWPSITSTPPARPPCSRASRPSCGPAGASCSRMWSCPTTRPTRSAELAAA